MQAPHVQAAVRTFRVAFAYLAVMTLVWLFLLFTGADGGLFFRDYRVTRDIIGRVIAGFLFFWVGWSWVFYRLKRTLLKRAGFGQREMEIAFANRLDGFDLGSLIAPYSERRIRIADRVGRRGRTFAA